jgi:RNA polymerase sigma-70 factor, ECF subfamily
VLGFSAKETADSLETTVASVNSALQRAREAIDGRLPEQSQQATLRTLGDEAIRQMVEKYMDAMDRCDVDAVVDLLTEDAAWSMPPMTTWYSGRDAIVPFLADYPLSGQYRWRRVPAVANGQPAVAAYSWDDDTGGYLPFALDVLTLRGDRISDITSFITRTAPPEEEQHLARWPHQPAERRLLSVFERLRLPERID